MQNSGRYENGRGEAFTYNSLFALHFLVSEGRLFLDASSFSTVLKDKGKKSPGSF